MFSSPRSIRLGSDVVFICGAAVVSVLLGLAVNSLQNKPLPLLPLSPVERLIEGFAVVTSPAKTPIADVELEEAMKLHEEEGVLFVDAREKAFFEMGHIPRAICLSRATFRADYPTFALSVKKGQKLIVYCSEVDCPDSTIVAKALLRLGFENVGVFKGGWEEWEAAGLPREP